jgi:type II secretory pathway component GspD/PulD (secretin)
MKKTLLVITLVAICCGQSGQAQVGQQMALLNSPTYEAYAAPLRSAPPRQYNFSKAVLSDVMRLMAEDAGIGFFGLPEGGSSGDNLVTFTLKASPFQALETLAKANGVALIFDSGIWYLRPANDQELIGRIYEINYNAQELVTKNSQSSGGSSGGSSSSGSGSSSGGGGGSAGLSLQGTPDFFVIEPSHILEDIQNILDIPTTGGDARFAPTTSVDNVSQFTMGGFQGQPDLVVRPGNTASSAAATSAGQSKVIWNSDSNTLYVVASRQQHQWIEAYLASADRPQPMIAVEVKFLETSRDPSSDLGIDWDGVLGQNGLQVNLSDATGPLNLGSVGGYSLPTAVLSYSDLNLKLRALFSDRKTKTVSYPRMVTLDNREVSFRSVVNQPVLGSSASASLGAGATQTSSVEYIPIGTVINILPKRMSGDKILLNVSVTVSDIIGTEMIGGNPYPIATSRVYTAPLTVQSGYTVAISGLDAARMEDTQAGVPILGRLPVIGYAFKNRKQDRSRQHLMMLITPIALNSGTEGLTEKPVSREPWVAPPVTYDYSSAKEPVFDGYRSNEDLKTHEVDSIPDFNDPVTSRKMNRSFGRDLEEMDIPIEANIAQRSIGARAMPVATPVAAPVTRQASTYSVPAAPPQSISVASGGPVIADLAPVPSDLNTPMIVEETPVALASEVESAVTVPPVTLSASSEATVEKPVAPPMAADAPPAKTEETVTPAKTVGAAAPAKVEGVAAPAEKTDPKVAEIKAAVEKLKAKLSEVPAGEGKLSPDDGQLVSNVFDEAQVLLDKVDTVRGDKSRPLQGELGDAWWDLINLKTQTMKLGRRSPESLAVSADGNEGSENKDEKK